MQNKLIVCISKITLRDYYTFKVLFNELYFIEYCLTDDKVAYLVSEDIKLNYSKNNRFIDEVLIESTGLLSEKGINKIDVNVQLINPLSLRLLMKMHIHLTFLQLVFI